MNDRFETAENWECPNIVTLCVDAYDAARQEGVLYHQYTGSPIRFHSLLEAFGQMEAFFDEICFPQAAMVLRSFFVDRRAAAGALQNSQVMPELPEFNRKEMIEMESFEDVKKHRGTDATFVIRVQNRQHASWQGEVTWIDGQKKEYFRSALELVRLIDGALNENGKAFES